MTEHERHERIESVRRRLEEREAALSPYAARGSRSRGRDRPEPPSPLRTEFQRDRDRIIHCKSFRRLKHKTQVFIAPSGDHFVTRLTHTLQVMQIARTIARALNLNEDLAEAIALAHDIGHAPFGHAGEEALSEALGEEWRHNYQGVRVVELLEEGGRGLNLTWETRNGIACSSKVRGDIFAEAWGIPATLEGQAVRLADALAYINHDILDAIRAGLLRLEDIPADITAALGATHRERVDTLVTDAVLASWDCTGAPASGAPAVRLSPEMHAFANRLREFLFERVYLHEGTRREVVQAQRVVAFLFEYYAGNPEAIASDYVRPEDPPERRAADYVSGMTDPFALRRAAELGCRAALDWPWADRLGGPL